jgi:hypothetical protein
MKTLNSLSGLGRPVGRRGRESSVRRWTVALGLAGLVTPAAAQEVYDYFPSVNPFSVQPTESKRNLEALNPNQWPDRPQIIQAEEGSQLSRYNIKLGPVFMSFRAGVIFRYQSNFNLVSSDNPQGQQDDFRIGPALSVNLRYDISEQARLVVNSGLTYQWSLNNNNNQLIFAPSSSLDYQFSVGQVQFSLSDSVAVASTAAFDPTISGTGDNSLTDFNRLNNNVRFGAEYPVFADTVLTGSYTFGIFRGLQNDNFNQLDRNAHTFAVGAQYMINPVWTVGLASQGNIMSYLPDEFNVSTGGGIVNRRGQIQNNSHGWGVGPTVAWRITEFMTLSGVAQYTVQNYERDGLIAATDTSNFEGMTFNLNLDHIINEYVTHGISGGRLFSPGNGSNFTDRLTVAYRLNWRFTSFASLNTSLRFLEFEQSGPGFAYVPFNPTNPPPNYIYITDDGIAVVPLNSGQQGQQYVFNIGTGFDLTDHLSIGINYSLAYKHLNQQFAVNTGTGVVPFGDYITQFVLLSLSYKF